MSKGFNGVIGVVLGLGCLVIVVPILLLGGLSGLGACVAGRGAVARTEENSTKSPVELRAADYGDQWPYPGFENARLDCKVLPGKIRRPLVIIELAGTWFGLNGAAMGVGGYPDSRQHITRDAEFGGYQLGATSDLIDMGLAICGE